MSKKTTIATSVNLQKKSDSALAAFKSLIASLKATNDEANAAKAANDASIAALQEENQAISVLTEKNEKIIQNVEGLLTV